MKYFKNFPIIEFKGSYVRNILSHVRFNDEYLKTADAYYPYILRESSAAGVSLENLAYDYYDDPNDVWMIRLFNEMIDPYYDTYLPDEQMRDFILNKYGSLATAQQKIKYYKSNWESDDTILSPSGYQSLSTNAKKYFKPIVNQSDIVVGYDRSATDIILNTIKTASFKIQNINDKGGFIENEIVTQKSFTQSDPEDGTLRARAQVAFSDETSMTTKHITTGAFVFSENNFTKYVIEGEESGQTAVIIKSTELLVNDIVITESISDEEVIYFSPVTEYDFEIQRNEFNKNIKLMDKAYASTVHSRFIKLFQQ